jgi:hypothetical protein
VAADFCDLLSSFPQSSAIGFPGDPVGTRSAETDRRDTLTLHHLLHVLGGDDAGIGRAVLFRDRQLSAAQRHRVEQRAAAHEALLGHVLDAERA